MRYQQHLQAALRKRYKRLKTADASDIAHEICVVTDWVSRHPTLCAILTQAELDEPGLDFEQWEKRLRTEYVLRPLWPCRTEPGKASLAWQLMQHITRIAPRQVQRGSAAERDPVQEYARGLTYGNNIHRIAKEFAERIISPLFDYLDDQIGGETTVLYALERYVRRIEWFDRDELHARYREDTRNGEKIYDKDLRKFLFAEGISMPFSQAQSASGLSDALAELDSEDPLVCELKIFDAAGHSKRSLAAGVNQVLQYAEDYGKAAAYLVIINLSGRPLELPTDGPAKTWPSYLHLAGVRVNLVDVRALPTPTASKQGKATPVTITRADLIGTDAAHSESQD